MTKPRNTARRKPSRNYLVWASLIVLALLLAAVVVAIEFYGPGLPRPGNAQAETRSADADGPVEPEAADAPAGELVFDADPLILNELSAFGSNLLLQVSQSRIAVLNLAGGEVFSFAVRMDHPQIVTKEGLALVYDSGGYEYVLLNQRNVRYSGRSEDAISAAVLHPDGYAALILERYGTKGILRVLDPDGGVLFDWISMSTETSGFIITADFAPDVSYIDVSLYNTDAGEPFPLINRFSLTDGETGRRLAQFRPNLQGAVSFISHPADGLTIVGDTERLVYITEDGLTLGAEFAHLRAAEGGAQGVALIAADSLNGQQQLRIAPLNPAGDILSGPVLSDQAGVPLSRGKWMAVSDGSLVYLLQGDAVNRIKTFDLKSPVLSLGLDERGVMLVVTRDGVRKIVP